MTLISYSPSSFLNMTSYIPSYPVHNSVSFIHTPDDYFVQKEPSEHAVSIFYRLIQNGEAKTYWDNDWKKPSVTLVGKIMDWFLGAGDYYLDEQAKIHQTAQSILIKKNKRNTENQYQCGPFPAFQQEQAACYIIEAGTQINNETCKLINPKSYNNNLLMSRINNSSFFSNLELPSDKLKNCLNQQKFECLIDCLICQTGMTNKTLQGAFMHLFNSTIVTDRKWGIITTPIDSPDISDWNYKLLINKIKRIVTNCEILESQEPSNKPEESFIMTTVLSSCLATVSVTCLLIFFRKKIISKFKKDEVHELCLEKNSVMHV